MPDQPHAIWTLPPGDADFSLRWRLIKTNFSRAIPARERRNRVLQARGERGISQRRFWEHLIREEGDCARHVEYCCINPVKHGLVQSVRAGLVPEDWAGDVGMTGALGAWPATWSAQFAGAHCALRP